MLMSRAFYTANYREPRFMAGGWGGGVYWDKKAIFINIFQEQWMVYGVWLHTHFYK